MWPWLLLAAAGLCEMVWITAARFSDGFTRILPGLVTVLAMGASLFLLAQAVRHIPVGTAYAVWTGIGAVCTAFVGILLFGESREPMRLACIALIILGIAGLRYTAPS